MKVAGIFRQYIWLVNTIHRARRITLSEINERWVKTELSGGMPMHRSLFSRHRKSIEEMFELCIECERRGNEYFYYIENEEVLSQGEQLEILKLESFRREMAALHERMLNWYKGKLATSLPNNHLWLDVNTFYAPLLPLM